MQESLQASCTTNDLPTQHSTICNDLWHTAPILLPSCEPFCWPWLWYLQGTFKLQAWSTSTTTASFQIADGRSLIPLQVWFTSTTTACKTTFLQHICAGMHTWVQHSVLHGSLQNSNGYAGRLLVVNCMAIDVKLCHVGISLACSPAMSQLWNLQVPAVVWASCSLPSRTVSAQGAPPAALSFLQQEIAVSAVLVRTTTLDTNKSWSELRYSYLGSLAL